MTETDFKDTYSVEVEMRGLDADGKHPIKTVEMSLVPYDEFISGIKRNPEIKRIANELIAKVPKLQESIGGESLTDETLSALVDVSILTDEMLESAAMIVISRQHPGLTRQITIKGGNDLVKAVRDNDLNEAFGLGEAIKALDMITEKAPEPETIVEPLLSMMSDSTDSLSTTSSSEPDGATEKS